MLLSTLVMVYSLNPNFSNFNSDSLISFRMPSSSYFKFVNNLKILVSAFNNLYSLFLSSSFNPSILFISSLAANLNFVVLTDCCLSDFLKYLFLSVPCPHSNLFFNTSFHYLVHLTLFLYLFLFHLFLVF